jgi:hypothetical protein
MRLSVSKLPSGSESLSISDEKVAAGRIACPPTTANISANSGTTTSSLRGMAVRRRFAG